LRNPVQENEKIHHFGHTMEKLFLATSEKIQYWPTLEKILPMPITGNMVAVRVLQELVWW